MEETLVTVTCLFTFLKDMIILFLEQREGREKERKRNIDVKEKYRSVASPGHLVQGPNMKLRHVP